MLIQRLSLRKILSFNDTAIDLGPLNVLIGPNAVGKSNLIEAIGLLKAVPGSLAGAISRGGGIRQWLWMGEALPTVATVECNLTLRRGRQTGPLSYRLDLAGDSNGYFVYGEELRDGAGAKAQRYFSRSNGKADLQDKGLGQPATNMDVPPGESILSQFRSPADPTPITEVGKHFSEIRIFREFRTGPQSAIRQGIATTAPKNALSDDGDNLAMVLQDFAFRSVDKRIQKHLARFCERYQDVKVDIGEGQARIFLQEAGLGHTRLSAARISDGTLKFLCLLAALFHPEPPPLMCIEEPELGLHPDAMQMVADAVIEASESVQLIVTTHSEALIDALTERPETVLVCERGFDNGTQVKRLSKKDLKEWLKHYSLGELWRKGEIGGGRW